MHVLVFAQGYMFSKWLTLERIPFCQGDSVFIFSFQSYILFFARKIAIVAPAMQKAVDSS